MTLDRTIVYDLLGIRIGNLTVAKISLDEWGSAITIDWIYTYPPEEKTFQLIFSDCRAIQWYILKSSAEMQDLHTAQVITHDLGQPNYQRTARIATVVLEIIISYGALSVKKDW